MRLIGETDKFLLDELPLEPLLGLQQLSKEKFAEELKAILNNTGVMLGMRLYLSDNYVLPLEEGVRDLQILTSFECSELFKDVVFMPAVGEVWDKVKTDTIFTASFEKVLQKEIFLRKRYDMLSQKSSFFMKRAKRKQLNRLKDEVCEQFCHDTVYLYGLLVYAKTLFQAKGGKWAEIAPDEKKEA